MTGWKSGGVGLNDNYIEVLQQYEGEAAEVRRGRGAWICTYPEGIRLLKEYRGSLQRLEFEENVLHAVRGAGIRMVDCCLRNREGELLTTAGDGTKYILKEWYNDRECYLNDTREVLTAVTWIARLHAALRRITWKEEWNLASMLPPMPGTEMLRHNCEMKRVRTFIHKKRRKNAFELCVMGNFERFFDQARQAQEGMQALEEARGQDLCHLCHGDLDQHHILIRGTEAGFIEFSQMHRGEQMEDLYHFMRKAMEKHNWNEHLGMSIIDCYDHELALTREERLSLYYLFLYPEKYWKQLNYYNNGNKAWMPDRNLDKLQNLEIQEENRSRFLSGMKRQIT
jgi:spore coat protein I